MRRFFVLAETSFVAVGFAADEKTHQDFEDEPDQSGQMQVLS
jgi:hypothetical protein